MLYPSELQPRAFDFTTNHAPPVYSQTIRQLRFRGMRQTRAMGGVSLRSRFCKPHLEPNQARPAQCRSCQDQRETHPASLFARMNS